MERRCKTLEDFPHFVVSGIQVRKQFPDYFDFSLIGQFDKTDGVSQGRSWLLLPERSALIGDFSNFDSQDGSAVFHSTGKEIPAVQGATLPYLSSYWQAYHVWMVLDGGSRWRRVRFDALDALSESFTADDGTDYRKLSKLKLDEDAPDASQVVAGGWDHEHCELCNAHIDDGNFGYTDTDGWWVCLSCFEKYVSRQDLSFIEDL
jgi:hypothetical protein